MATYISHGAIPQFSMADIFPLIIDGLYAIWIELTLSVLATIVYGVHAGIIAWVPRTKAQPKSEEAQGNTSCLSLQNSDDVSLKTEKVSIVPNRCLRTLLILIVIVVGIVVGGVMTLAGSPVVEDQKPSLQQPKAEKEDAIAILQRQLAQSPDAAARHKVIAALAATLRAQGDLKGAAKHLAQAAEVANEAKDHWGSYEAFLALASLQRRLGRLSEAAASATTAVEMAKAGLPEATDLDSLIVRRDSMTAKAAAHAELAQVRRDEGKLIEASGLFKLTGKTDVEVAEAAYHVLKGNTEDAIQSLVKALERLEKSERAEALLWLSRAQRDSGKTKEALEAAHAAVAVAGSSHPDTAASAHLHAAGVLTQLAVYDKAEANLKAAEELLATKDLDFLLADVEIARATIVLYHGDAALAESMVKNALTLKKAAGGQNTLAASQVMVLLGQTLLSQGRPEDALKMLEDAKRNMLHFHGFFNGLTARLKWHIAAAHEAMGKNRFAIIQRRAAIDDVITPPRGSAELSPAAAADRMFAIFSTGRENMKEIKSAAEQHKLCTALLDRGPGDEKAFKRRSEVVKAWGHCPHV